MYCFFAFFDSSPHALFLATVCLHVGTNIAIFEPSRGFAYGMCLFSDDDGDILWWNVIPACLRPHFQLRCVDKECVRGMRIIGIFTSSFVYGGTSYVPFYQ